MNVYLYMKVITMPEPKYKLHSKEWESDSTLKMWITPVEGADMKALIF